MQMQRSVRKGRRLSFLWVNSGGLAKPLIGRRAIPDRVEFDG
jgi:hypothetical protein